MKNVQNFDDFINEQFIERDNQKQILIEYTRWLSKQDFKIYSSSMVDAFLGNVFGQNNQKQLLINYTRWLSKQEFEAFGSNMVDAFLGNFFEQ